MIRIKEHPILGKIEKGRLVKFIYNGQVMEGFDGEPIAAALKAAGILINHYTEKRQEPRGMFCAIGRCTDCIMIVDSKSNVRTCITKLNEGMVVETQYGAGRNKEDFNREEI